MGNCEDGNKPSISIKVKESLGELNVVVGSQGGFCSMQTVTFDMDNLIPILVEIRSVNLLRSPDLLRRSASRK